MIKKILCLFLMVSAVISLYACTAQEPQKPAVEQVRYICKLATLECYYNNVAVVTKQPDKGIKHILEKERNMWIEYTGVVTLGIDFSKVKLIVEGDNITITIPDAEVLNIKEKQGERKIIVSEDGFNSNKITADEQTGAINNAQKNMEVTAKSNSALLLNAQQRAKDMIETYVDKIGSACGITYNIIWESVDK